eukprot:TRINITY_DN37475_c0_g1_i1.p1 TRINITY_DN37475_c0_g1~~TRINITY_DN37475_c0_g1_i1.p1  ORF type:complete len:269 (+),score=66.58 TRINITY_DN37475_c0_g1_i1:124-930(+)
MCIRDRLHAPMEDIWTRDFGPVLPMNPVQFKYTPAAQGGKAADSHYVQSKFVKLAKRLKLEYKSSRLVMDGGNLVDNGYPATRVVVTDRFLQDNDLDKREAIRMLQEELCVEDVAVIPSDDPDGLAHADGQLMFTDADTLLVNRYDHDPEYRAELLKVLELSLPEVRVVEIVAVFDETDPRIDPHFGSAFGIYVNSVVTQSAIYVPQFGIMEDREALETIRANTSKVVVPIRAETVAYLGGSVRCLSLQCAGANASKILAAANTSKHR